MSATCAATPPAPAFWVGPTSFADAAQDLDAQSHTIGSVTSRRAAGGDRRCPEASLSPDLARLVALQAVDSELQSLHAQLEVMPRQEAETAARVRRTKEALADLEERVKRMTLERREGEKEVESLADQERKFQGRTVDVKTNEELWALQKEIRGVQAKRSDKETAVLEAMEREDAERGKRSPLEAEVKDAEARHEQNRARIVSESEALRARVADRQDERERRVAELPPALRARYERVLASGRNPAVVPLSKNACGGCYTAQPPQRIQEVRQGEFVVVCEFCGRLLIGTAEPAGGPASP